MKNKIKGYCSLLFFCIVRITIVLAIYGPQINTPRM
jgi:hypothetical protein